MLRRLLAPQDSEEFPAHGALHWDSSTWGPLTEAPQKHSAIDKSAQKSSEVKEKISRKETSSSLTLSRRLRPP